MNNHILLIHADKYVKIFCSTVTQLKDRIKEMLRYSMASQEVAYFTSSLFALSDYEKEKNTRIICYQHHGNCMQEHLCTVYPFFIDHGLAYRCSQNEDAHWYCSYFIVKKPDGRRDAIGNEIFTDADTGKEFVIDLQRGNIAYFSLVRTINPFHKG